MTIAHEGDAPGIIEPAPIIHKGRMGAVVPAISLSAELIEAGEGGVVAGLGAFVGANTVVSFSDWNSFKVALVGAGFAALTSIANSLKNWYQQKYGVVIS